MDAHHHLWDTRRLYYPLFDQIPALNRPFPVPAFDEVAGSMGVTASVCVEAASAGADGMAELAWLREQADQSGTIKAIVAWAPVEQPEIAAYLGRLIELDDRRIVGIRRSFEFEAPDFPSSPDVVAGVRRLGDTGLTFDLVLFPDSLRAATELVRQCPDVSFILDHLGKPPIRAHALEPWSTELGRLAALPNVVCKISGMSTEADRESWSAADLAPYWNRAVDCFGWNRLLFGSDWPVCNLARGYEAWLAAVDTLLAGVPSTDRAKFFAENARRIYRLPGPTPTASGAPTA